MKKRIKEICNELDVDIYWKNCNFLENEEDDSIPTFYNRDECRSISFRELLVWYLPVLGNWQDEPNCDECEFDEYKKYGFPRCSVGEIYWYAPREYREPEKVKVSMLQQKADKSWKIRLSPQNSGFGVFDITLEKFNNYCFTTEEKAMKYLEEWRR